MTALAQPAPLAPVEPAATPEQVANLLELALAFTDARAARNVRLAHYLEALLVSTARAFPRGAVPPVLPALPPVDRIDADLPDGRSYSIAAMDCLVLTLRDGEDVAVVGFDPSACRALIEGLVRVLAAVDGGGR